ncbi:MAG TPA: DUF2946 domain-containing protein [Paraburkholderia sp.]|jgi:hypothetical protein
MSLSTRRRLTASLGLIAMWLVVLVPLVSQLIVAARVSDPITAPLCSVVPPAPGSAHNLQHTDLLTACGYCDLLANHPAAPAVPPPMLFFVVLIVATIVPALSTRFMPLGAFRSGRPRGPPRFRSFGF